MIKFLSDLLAPVAYSRGVSEADFASYMNLLTPYIYAFLFVLLIFVIFEFCTVLFSEREKEFMRAEGFIAFVLAILIIVNMASFGPMRSTIAGALNTLNIKVSEQSRESSKEIVRRVGEEGFVLLKNNGVLPLNTDEKDINVFGWASISPVYGGTGSGSSDTANNVNILDSLANAGFNTNPELTKMYREYKSGRVSPGLSMNEQNWDLPEPTVQYYTDTLIDNAKRFSNTAIIVLGRSGGEGADLPMDMRAIIDNTYNIADKVSVKPQNYGYFGGKYENNGDTPDFENGESYLELSKPEKDMIKKVTDNFSNVIVVINANNPMELSWVDEYSNIGAVIYAPGAGVTGFEALGKIINGSINPSGKTVDTFVKDLFKTPYINNIGSHIFTNVEDLNKEIAQKDDSSNGVMSFVNYVEGIYVGYKFYETAHDVGFIKYNEHVQYPFGYGLSYTTFEKKIESFVDNGDNLMLEVSVTNTGERAGKDVVELYYTPPYTNGGIEKASVNLIGFEKTKELAPGENISLSFLLNKEDMASYDSAGKKIPGGGYILEAGEYEISLRNDSHTPIDSQKFAVAEDIFYNEEGRRSDKTSASNKFETYARGKFTELSRANKFANYEAATQRPAEGEYLMDDATKEAVKEQSVAYYNPEKNTNPSDTMPTQGAKNGLKLYDMVSADYDDERWEKLIDQMTFEEMSTLVNIGGWQTAEIKSIGKVATMDADGPAGLNNFITKVYGTSYPAEILMAQTWNRGLMQDIGEGISREFSDVNYYGWYGPAVNTHRSAFAGRNFEYFSEDGFLSGQLAAAEMNGAADNRVYPYIKHFALNDQETNRCAFLLTYASEQAIRETYLKPFELAIKSYKGRAQAVMSSFNFIGTISSSSNSNLLNDVLRDEWGFKGMVITDYDGSYGYMISDKSIKNGNDLMLGFALADSNKLTDKSATTTIALRKASKNILYTVVNSGVYENGDPSGRPDGMTKFYRNINIATAVLLILSEFFVIRAYIRRRRELY